MKIVSSFHDYYDIGLALGHDDSTVYVRDTGLASVEAHGLLSKDLLPWEAESRQGWSRRAGTKGVNLTPRDRGTDDERAPRWQVRPHDLGTVYAGQTECMDEAFVLVVGKAYPVWVRQHAGDHVALGGERSSDLAAGDTDPKALAHQMQRLLQAQRPGWKGEVRIKPTNRNVALDRVYDHARERFLAQDFTPLHLAAGAPVLLVADIGTLWGGRNHDLPETLIKERQAGRLPAAGIIRNPNLASLGLARTLDPYSAFQAINQFIDGVVPGRQMPMATISDPDQVRKKGFDPKYGFRTRPRVG